MPIAFETFSLGQVELPKSFTSFNWSQNKVSLKNIAVKIHRKLLLKVVRQMVVLRTSSMDNISTKLRDKQNQELTYKL